MEMGMLGDHDAVATVAVKDMARAKGFYEGTLGLRLDSGDQQNALVYASGHSKLIVYQSEFAGTNAATAVNWFLGGELDETVRALRAKGVVFEHYDFPGMTREGDVHVMGDMRMAWFKDPDGNILALM
jgi:catechol 2,3-dioxygenase-like lactoylglutathione lyase family enzyme